MEETFKAFRDYDFDNDDRFTSGAKQLDPLVANTLQAKHFYYSTFVQSFSLDDYRSWLNDGRLQDSGDSIEHALPETASEESIKQAPYSLSFKVYILIQEIIEKVGKGETIPGIKVIPTTTHTISTEATLKPMAKPWETPTESDCK
jgi:hypothetical protein